MPDDAIQQGAAAGAAAAGNGAAPAWADTAIDVNTVPEDARPFFSQHKVAKMGDLFALAQKGATPPAPSKFGRDVPLDLSAFTPDHQRIFQAKKLENVGALADQVLSVEKLIGQLGGQPLLKPEAGKLGTWLADNADALGRPKAATDYTWNKPEMPKGVEFNAEMEGQFREFAFKNNIPNELFQPFADFGAQLLTGQAQALLAKEQQDITETAAALQKDWGADLKKNQEIAAAFARSRGYDSAMIDRLARENGSAATLKMLYDLGKDMEGATLINGDGNSAVPAKAQAQAQLEALEADPAKSAALNEASHPQHKAVVDERTRLMAIISGS